MSKVVKENGLILDVHERPTFIKWAILSLQHVFAMFGATVLVPIIVNDNAGREVISISTALIASGIGTLIYIACTKAKSPVYLGSSFAFIGGISTVAIQSGDAAVFTGLMIVGLVYVVFAVMIHFLGTGWVDALLPPIIIGPMIIVIGLGLAPVAISSMGLVPGSTVNAKELIVAIVALVATASAAILGKGFIKIIPFLVGIITGYIVAALLGIVNFKPIAEAAWFGVPNLVFPFIGYSLDFSGIATLVPIAIVTLAEHIGDHTVLSQIINKPLLKDPGLPRTLLGDGLATFASAGMGGPVNTTYGENTSVVGLSKVASIYVIGLAAIFAIILSFIGKFIAVIQSIPGPVLGGVSILLFGFIASNGIRVLVDEQVDFSKTQNVVVASTMLVLGLGGAQVTLNLGFAQITLTGMVLAAICGIILNMMFNVLKKVMKTEE